MKTADFLVFIVYGLTVLLIGVWFYRRNKTPSAFMLANQTVPSWVISLSFFATFVSSISYLALPGSAYQADWSPFVFSISIPLAAFMAVKIFVPLYRRVQSPSAYTYLDQRFGPWARIYAATMYLLTQIMRVGTILYLMAVTVNAMSGWDVQTIIVITGVVVAIYAILGGIQAVVWTDALQAVVLISGAIVCIVYLLFSMPDGPSQVFQIGMNNHKFSLGSMSLDLAQPTFWVILIYGIFVNLQNYGIDQNYVQRYMIAGSESEAKKSAFWGGMLYIPVSLMFLFIGTCLYAYYGSGAGELPAVLREAGKGDLVFPHFIVHGLPSGVAGLLLSSIFAAGMSTVSTSYNSAATVVLTNFITPARRETISERKKMAILYVCTILVSLVGISVAIAMINVKSALDAWWKLASVFSGGMLGLFLLGVFSRQKNFAGALVGTITGLLVILYLTVSDIFGPETSGVRLHTYLTIVIGTLTIFLVGFGIGVMRGNKQN